MLAAVAFANLVVAALHFGLAAAGPLVRRDLDIDTATLGLVLAAPAIGLMLGTYGWGVLADRTSERRVLTGAFVGFAVAALVAAASASPDAVPAFVAALLATGLFGSAAHSAGGRVISASFPPERHGLVLSIRHVAIPVGAAIGGLLVPALVRSSGLEHATLEFGLLGFVAAIVLAVVVPSSRSVAALAARAGEVARGGSPLRLPHMWLLAVGAGSLAFVQLGIGSFLTLQFVDRAEVALAIAAGVFTAAQLAGAAGRIVLGIVSDRARDRVGVLIAVGLVAMSLVAVSLLTSSAVLATTLQAIALVAVTSCNGVVVAVAASLAPPGRTGATLGMQTTANAAACAIAPIGLGFVLAQAGWMPYLWTLVASCAVSLAALTVLRRRRPALS